MQLPVHAETLPKPMQPSAIVVNGQLRQDLNLAWQAWKARYLREDGAVIVPEWSTGPGVLYHNVALSEGQSYAMLMAVWANDAPTFSRVWHWTQAHLQQRKTDRLLGWLWGPQPAVASGNGLIETDYATDANEDVAYALILAATQWKQPAYLQAAQLLLKDIRQQTLLMVAEKPYLKVGAWGQNQWYVVINPSYLSPVHYRAFAQVDSDGATQWLAAAEATYPALEGCSRLTPLNLPPDWCGVDYGGKMIPSFTQPKDSLRFGHDAFRVFWRMRLAATHGDALAERYLSLQTALAGFYNQQGYLPDGFDEHGKPIRPDWLKEGQSSPWVLAMLLAQSWQGDGPSSENQAKYQLLRALQQQHKGLWADSDNYYGNSLVWMTLYSLLPKN
ncbi:MAG: glycosyl hydrolase family 8 [Candidatus Melainabacteria bacterium]|nr:glycosyl hydrolase family 8 [Candidatus Melainabacteria bacterium]